MDNQVELQILAKLAELVGRVDALTGEVRALRAELQTTRGEKAAKLEALLAAIHGELGPEPWPVSWLVDDEQLVEAVCAIIGKHKPNSRGERIGIFLSRHLGVTGRWRLDLTRAGTRSGNLYRVTPVTIPSQPSHGTGGHVK